MKTPFLPGQTLSPDRPLGRFLPPIQAGAITHWIRANSLAGKPLIDPFGTSPWLPVEAAMAGSAVLVAVNNPVTRFVLERYLDPLSAEELQSTLARLATVEKDDQRLENFMLDLYRTRCNSCGEWVSADYFVWDQEQVVPIGKGYICPHCNHGGEEETTPQDREQALSYHQDRLAHARALESVAPLGDPNRQQAEAALSVYPGRALYAVVTLINKATQLSLPGRQAVALQALLLCALDSADNMWAHPEGRQRPKQLSPSPIYRESNLWRALERGVESWAGQGHQVGISWWPEGGSLEPGSVSIFAGSVRQLAQQLPAIGNLNLATVPPRPNQAFWTLSALWAAWIWGRETAEPLRAALRRRRYDWAWHAEALRQTGEVLGKQLAGDFQFQMFIPESEVGYSGACLAGFDAAGLRLTGSALRLDERQAQLTWTGSRDMRPTLSWTELQNQLPDWIARLVSERGEPTHFQHAHFAAAAEVAATDGFGQLWRTLEEPPVSKFQREVEEALAQPERFTRLDQRQDPETGLYWLTLPDPLKALNDEVERAVLQALREQQSWELMTLDAKICRLFPGGQTPDYSWVEACVESYAERGDDDRYRLRSEDRIEARGQDVTEMRQGLRELAERLDYEVAGQDPLLWLDQGQEQFAFCVLATSILSEAADEEDYESLIYVLPGGRAALIAEKARRDPRLMRKLETGLIIIKFRHVRRLLSDTTLNRDNFLERLTIDPPENQDPQLPLL